MQKKKGRKAMEDNKWFVFSKTIWGMIIMIWPQLSALLGINFDLGVFSDFFATLAPAIGAFLVLWGRLTAVTSLKWLP